ncbi:hypothetical protein QP896_003505 [Corynebacterium rhinophilum]|uniref:hypothetical protein n=1 Tax=Corynebacterium rhinophilum TaxID=3050197 RepID=UPI00254C7FE3|nr:hypothetical protein [Corynebacterium sp. MSK293]MDK8766600.1 hypothetical protein [Corynebacterium sp. MSK293]
MRTLAQAVTGLVRSNDPDLNKGARGVYYSDRIYEAAELLEQAEEDPAQLSGIVPPSPSDIVLVGLDAVEEVLKTIPRVNDYAHAVRDAGEVLARVVSSAAQQASYSGCALADWFIRMNQILPAEEIDLDPVYLAPAFGEEGVARIRSWNTAEQGSGYVGRRLAVLEGTSEAVLRTHGLKGSAASRYEEIIAGLCDIGRYDLAFDWSEKAVGECAPAEIRNIASGWAVLAKEHFTEHSERVARSVFDTYPELSFAQQLYAAGTDKAKSAAHIQDTLAAKPWDLAMFQHLSLEDPGLAWRTVIKAGMEQSMAQRFLDDLPAQALPFVRDDVATYLDSTKVGRDMGIELLQTMREKSAELGDPWDVDFNVFLTGLRRRYAERHVILRRLDEVSLIA